MHPLAQLLKKTTEANIVGYLAVSPLRAHTNYELAKRLNLTPLKCKQALLNLTEEGWLRTYSRQGRDFYILNHKFKPANELRQALLRDKPAPQDDFTSAVKKLGHIKSAYLSGVFMGHPELQVDLLVVGTVNEVKLNEFLHNSQELLGFELNYTTLTEPEFIERRSMLDRFLRDLFDNPFLTIIDTL